MARLTPPAIEDLAAFSGQNESIYTDYADTCLSQATLLFELASGLDEYPDAGTPDGDLASNAICEMADALYLRLPFRKVLGSPFSSESIGSYSYSKLAPLVAQGIPTGLGWFDMAITRLGVEGGTAGLLWGTSIAAFENDADIELNDLGHREFVGPEDIDRGGPGFVGISI